MNISTTSDGRKSNHHETSRSHSPTSGSRSPSSKRRESGPPAGHFGFPPRGGIDAGSPYGPFNPAAIAAMRSIPGYTGLLGTSSPPTISSASAGSSLNLPLGDSASPCPENIPLALYQSPIWQAAMRQQQMQILASLGGAANPLLPNHLAQHHPGHPPPQMPPNSSQVHAAVALLAASAHGNGIGSAGYPSTTGIRRQDAPIATPDSSCPDVSGSSNAATLAALIAASASSSGTASSNTPPVDSSVAIKAYHDYLSLTNKLQSEQKRHSSDSDNTAKQFFNSLSNNLDKHRLDNTGTDSLTTSKQTSMSHQHAVLLMAEQLRRDKSSLPSNTTSAVSSASPITSRNSAESTQAKTSTTTPFNVRTNLSSQENSLKRDLLPPTYSSSANNSSSTTSPTYRHPIINAEDAKRLNLQLQQHADFVKLLNEGSSNALQVVKTSIRVH